MNKYEAASFYGDYRELLAEIADELYDEKIECTTMAESFNDNAENFDIDLVNEIVKSLDLYKDKKISIESRYNSLWFISAHADICVSHQWENAQNYLYYDVLHGGYPLIHNSPMLGDAGYYYPGFDSEAGGRALLEAWQQHDLQLDHYQARANALLRSVAIDNLANLDAFTRRLLA